MENNDGSHAGGEDVPERRRILRGEELFPHV
jgi:hypothetical protein